MLATAREWATAAHDLDKSLLALNDDLKEREASEEVLEASAFVVAPIEQRKTMYGVWEAVQKFQAEDWKEEVIEEKSDAGKLNKVGDVDTEEVNVWMWILSIALIGTVVGVIVCRLTKSCCFKEEGMTRKPAEGTASGTSMSEGGECSDKKLFKQ